MFAREVTRTSPTSRSTSTVVMSSVAMCAELKFYCRVWDHFVRQADGKSILPRLFPGNGPGGAMYTRLPCLHARPILTPQLAVVCLRAYNNYFVTIIQRWLVTRLSKFCS